MLPPVTHMICFSRFFTIRMKSERYPANVTLLRDHGGLQFPFIDLIARGAGIFMFLMAGILHQLTKSLIPVTPLKINGWNMSSRRFGR